MSHVHFHLDQPGIHLLRECVQEGRLSRCHMAATSVSLEMGYNAKAYWFVHALVPVNKFFVLLPGGNCVVGYSMEDLSEDLGLCAGQESSIKIREIYAHIVNSTRHPYTFPKRVCYWVIETVGIYIRFWN